MSGILSIDSSTDRCIVAFEQNGEISATIRVGRRTHAEHLLPMILEVAGDITTQGDRLDAIAVVAGPGSFTGVRIGVSVVQGLALALAKPVLTLSSLQLLATAAAKSAAARRVIVAILARPGEYYSGVFDLADGRARAVGDEELFNARQIASRVSDPAMGELHGIGDAWLDSEHLGRSLTDRLASLETDLRPDAEALCRLSRMLWEQGEAVSVEAALPRYLKEDMHYTPTKRGG